MNGFERHGIKSTSASQINKWIDAPDAWLAEKVLGKKFKFSGAMKAGVYAEQALMDILAHGYDIEEAIKKAEKDFRSNFMLMMSDKEHKALENIKGFVEQALPHLEPYGVPYIDKETFNNQKMIKVVCNGGDWKIDIIGYLDFVYPEHKRVIDLKTTGRMPSVMSKSHMIQGAIYKHAMPDYEHSFLYVTPKKAQMFDIEAEAELMGEIKQALIKQEKFLSLGDADFLKEIMPVTNGGFYWNDNLDIRKEIYGL